MIVVPYNHAMANEVGFAKFDEEEFSEEIREDRGKIQALYLQIINL